MTKSTGPTGTATILTRGTLAIDVEACQGGDLCIDACPPGVLVMTTHDVNERGTAIRSSCPVHRVQGVLPDLPRLRVPGLQVRHPGGTAGRGDGDRSERRGPGVMSGPAWSPGPSRTAGAPLMHGSEAIAEAMIAAGCRFFAGYPMTPFTEVLEEMARKLPDARGGVHERGERDRGGRHGLGAAATGTPAATGSTGQGSPSCRSHWRRSPWPACRSSS